MINFKEKLKDITTFIFDYDGVLTDGKVLLMNDGEAVRTANVKDGYAMQYAIKKGFRIVIISGGNSEAITQHFTILNVQDVFLAVSNKLAVYEEYLQKHNLRDKEVLYMGDDIPDYHVMRHAGLAVCPSNAAVEIKAIAAYISDCKGGEGCVRDVIEQTLKVQGKWFDAEHAFEW